MNTSRLRQVLPKLTDKKVFVLFGLLVIAFFISFSDYSPVAHLQTTNVECVKCHRQYRQVMVHLDLKGAPPRVDYFRRLFPLLKANYVDAVLIEYEDMFPFTGLLKDAPRLVHYSNDDIRTINEIAKEHGLDVVPLIQTFGHLEFVLKHSAFVSLREDVGADNTICPSDPRSLQLIEEMIVQIKRLHPYSKQIHIGADEAYHVAEDMRCMKRMYSQKMGKAELTLQHIAKVGALAKKSGFEKVFVWNDMFDKENTTVLLNSGIHKHVTPVVWGYAADVTREDYFPRGLFDRLTVFDEYWIASAFKGANGINQTFIDIERYLNNHKSYKQLLGLVDQGSKDKVGGIIVTGWSRFMHHGPLCELLYTSIPSLLADLMYINYPKMTDRQLWSSLKTALNCSDADPGVAYFYDGALHDCRFLGSDVFKLVMSDWRAVSYKAAQVTNETLNEAKKVIEKVRKALRDVMYKRDVDEFTGQLRRAFGPDNQKNS